VQFSMSSDLTTILMWLLIGLVLGLLLSRLGPARRRLAVAEAERDKHRAELEARDARIAALEREVAASRDQIRPLSDEVDRLRRDNARLISRGASASTVDMSGAGLAGGAMAPTLPPEGASAEPLPPFLDAPRGQPDDLRMLKGVGDRFAAKLNEIGVFHYRQIAGWSPEDARIADQRLDTFRGRIERDQLVEQAKLLASGRTTEYEARFGKIGGGYDIPGPV
jgi:predicted flap endonuclease-1-like 5' DNA nuclease/cell division protein FtsB